MVRYQGDLKVASKNNFICWENTCLAFGEVANQVKGFFNGFTTFHYASKIIKRIGKVSANGFVFEIRNETRQHVAYSVLKSAQQTNSDNLMYEYNVGLFLNSLVNKFPCFVETYGLFKYKTDRQWQRFSNINANQIVDKFALQNALLIQPLDYEMGCLESKMMAVLIQHLPDPKTMHNLVHQPDFVKNELIYALFQLYMPLAFLMDKFTHYDLHLENILLYEPMKNGYIEYHYHFNNGGIVSFKSSYLLKIIDYGRSFFFDTEENNSLKIYEQISFNTKCLQEAGFDWLQDDSEDPYGTHKYFISSQHRNISHDLLPLERIRLLFMNKAIFLPLEISDLVKKVDYRNEQGQLNEYGKKENAEKGSPLSVNNVGDAAQIVMNIISTTEYMQANINSNRLKKKLGDLHIFPGSNKDMQFEAAPDFREHFSGTPYARRTAKRTASGNLSSSTSRRLNTTNK